MTRPDLVADCTRCAALCCVWSAFEASDDFAFSKPAGVTCRHLQRDHHCAIHDQLAGRGLRGCAAYDCHGAGPRATHLFAATRLTDRQRHDAFLVVRDVHELLWLLAGAAALCPGSQPDLAAELARAIAALDALAGGPAAAILEAELAPHRAATRQLLHRLRIALAGSPASGSPCRPGPDPHGA